LFFEKNHFFWLSNMWVANRRLGVMY